MALTDESPEAHLLRLANELDDAHADIRAAHDRERATRMRLLRIHAWMSILAGLLMTITGTAQIFEQRFGLWTRPALGNLAVAAGIMLVIGVDGRHGHRQFTLEATGLLLVGAWDVAMGAGFILSLFVYGHVQLRWPWDDGPIDLLQPRPYGPVIYFGLAAMVSFVHLAAVLRDRQDAQAARA